jgi:hypothetical protein
LSTIFPEAAIYDRATLFGRHRTGFAQSVKEWGQELGVSSLVMMADKVEAGAALGDLRAQSRAGAWETFARMSSTRAFASLVGGEAAFHELALEASRRSRLGLRVFLLSITGSLSLSYTRTRFCSGCGEICSFEHFISCPAMGDALGPLMAEYVAAGEWKLFVDLLLGRFEVFIHLIRGGQLLAEESELFDALHFESSD